MNPTQILVAPKGAEEDSTATSGSALGVGSHSVATLPQDANNKSTAAKLEALDPTHNKGQGGTAASASTINSNQIRFFSSDPRGQDKVGTAPNSGSSSLGVGSHIVAAHPQDTNDLNSSVKPASKLETLDPNTADANTIDKQRYLLYAENEPSEELQAFPEPPEPTAAPAPHGAYASEPGRARPERRSQANYRGSSTDAASQALIQQMLVDDLGGGPPDDPPQSPPGGGDVEDALVEAQPVQDDSSQRNLNLGQAKPMDQGALQERTRQLLACGLLAVVCLALGLGLGLGLGFGLGGNQNNQDPGPAPTGPPTASPTVYLPPLAMAQLEELYQDLPQTSRESLRNSTSPQYQAWEFLEIHPEIDDMEEWRKKQIFALATFFYSFHGPDWDEKTRKNWMNPFVPECAWILTQEQIGFLSMVTGPVFGTHHDFSPCNEEGVIQTIVLQNVQFQNSLPGKPVMPPEIQLLTGMKILGMVATPVSTGLNDFLVPEIQRLTNLELLSIGCCGMDGPIPSHLLQMSNLTHVVLSTNAVTGTIPAQLGNLSNLEMFSVLGNKMVGSVPTELGTMAALTTLFLAYNAFTGTLPTELGGINTDKYRKLSAQGNHLTGTIPTQLGGLTNIQFLGLSNNALEGSIPSELGLLTRLSTLELGNGADPSGLKDNNFDGTFPTELWKLSHMTLLELPDLPNLSGSIPDDLWMPNLTGLLLNGSPKLEGTIAESFCSIENLEFDCSDVLCGCSCHCMGDGNQTMSNLTNSTLQIDSGANATDFGK